MNREILRLAIPNILSNISVPLLSSVDTALMGRLSEAHIGAVGLGSMIFNFIYWNFGFLRMGTTGITAQAFGAKSRSDMLHTLLRALVVGLAVAALLLLLQGPFGRVSFYLMNVPEGQLGLVADYFYIRIWAAPATLALYAVTGWFLGMQNAVYPLLLTILVNVINIVCSYVLVWHWGWEVRGVAWGTVVAQYAGVLFAAGLFLYRYRELTGAFRKAVLLRLGALKRFLSINGDIFLRTVCLTFAFAFFYAQSADAGEMILAVNVILLQYLNWMSYAVDGFAFASESLVGKYAGARDVRNTRRAIAHSFGWGMGAALVFSLSYWAWGEPLLRVFTNQEDVLSAALDYLPWMILLPLAGTPCYIWDGVFIGLTAARAMRDTMLLSLGLFLLAWFFLTPALANHGLWLALILFLLARGAIQWLWYHRRWGDL